jgi:hypothetical protein
MRFPPECWRRFGFTVEICTSNVRNKVVYSYGVILWEHASKEE